MIYCDILNIYCATLISIMPPNIPENVLFWQCITVENRMLA